MAASSRVDSGFDDEILHNGSSTEDEVFHEVIKHDIDDDSEDDTLVTMTTEKDKRKSSVTEIAQNAVKQRFLSTLDVVKTSVYVFGATLSVWLLGYFEFSALWLLIGVGIYSWREQRKNRYAVSDQVANELANDERKFLQTVQSVYKITGKDLPSWVYFPDIEKAEWLNKIVAQMWPYVGDYVKSMLEEQIQPSIQQSNSLLSSFRFLEVDLGDRAPRVVGVKVYGNGLTRRTEIVMDMHFVFHSDVNIKVGVNALSAGIKNLTVKGQMRIELRPLIDKIPLVGAVSVAFLEKPFINFDLTDFGNFLDLPGIDTLLRGAVMDCVCGMLVLPERYILKLSDVDISSLKYPMPKGVVRVHIIEAQNLEEKDKKILGIGGGSDPYVVVTVGRDVQYKTTIVQHNVNPSWNECFDALVHDVHGTTILVTLYDDDGALNKADYLGSASVPVKSVYKRGLINEWITLDNVSKGSIHICLEWMELSSNKSDLNYALSEAKKYGLDSAFVNVYVDSAKEVVDVNEPRYEPCPQLRVQFPNKTKPWKSSIIDDSANPVWEENCKSLIPNPRGGIIKFVVENSSKTGSGEMLGELKIKTNQLLESPSMTKEEPFALNSGGPSATLTMRITMRLLVPVGLKEEVLDKAFVVSKKKTTVSDENKLSTSLHSIAEDDSGNSSTVDPPITPITPVTPSRFDHKREGSTTSSIKFVDRSLAYFYENSPASHRSLNRSSSINSAVSDNSGSDNIRLRLDKSLANKETANSTNKFPLGRLNLSIKYLKASETLLVDVNRAENLIICDDDDGTSDPYVRIYVLPGRKKRKKTRVLKHSLNPQFDETLKFDMTETEMRRCQLEVAVKNETSLLSSEKVLMGQLYIDLATVDFPSAINKWYSLSVHSHSD